MSKLGRPTFDEVYRRRQAVTELFRLGFTFEKIALALDIGKSTATKDANELGLRRGKGRRPISSLNPGDPPIINWRTDPKYGPNQSHAYITSPIPADASRWIDSFNSGDFPNRLAWNIHEAETVHDVTWVNHTRAMLEEMRNQAEQLLRVMNDDRYRETCMHGVSLDVRTERDRPSLRVVQK